MAHDELQTLAAIVFIDTQTVYRMDIVRRGFCGKEADGIEAPGRR